MAGCCRKITGSSWGATPSRPTPPRARPWIMSCSRIPPSERPLMSYKVGMSRFRVAAKVLRFSRQTKSSFARTSLIWATAVWRWTWPAPATIGRCFGCFMSPTFLTFNIRNENQLNGRRKLTGRKMRSRVRRPRSGLNQSIQPKPPRFKTFKRPVRKLEFCGIKPENQPGACEYEQYPSLL